MIQFLPEYSFYTEIKLAAYERLQVEALRFMEGTASGSAVWLLRVEHHSIETKRFDVTVVDGDLVTAHRDGLPRLIVGLMADLLEQFEYLFENDREAFAGFCEELGVMKGSGHAPAT